MYLPGYYDDPVEEYWALLNDVTLWDVSVERIVEITGPDALRVHEPADLPRPDEVRGRTGQVRADHRPGRRHRQRPGAAARRGEHAGGSPSPTATPASTRCGVAVESGLDVTVREPEVYPVQVQGPKSKDVMRDAVRRRDPRHQVLLVARRRRRRIPVVISRTGWTGEVGYEVYLRDPSRGDDLWDRDHGGGQAARHPPDRPVRGAPDRGRHLQLRLGHHARQQPVRGHGARAAGRAAGRRLRRQGGARADPRRGRVAQARRHRGRRRRAAVRARRVPPGARRRRAGRHASPT